MLTKLIQTESMKIYFPYSLVLILVLMSNLRCTKPSPKLPPNVLFISIDDLNDWIEPLGGLDIAITPHLSRLSDEAMTFTNAHCPSPSCAPSRIAIMTGVHPVKSDIMKNKGGDGPFWRSNPALSEISTMEQFFRSEGYMTLAGGKIYHTLAPPRTIMNQAEPESWDFWFPSAHIPIPFQERAPDSVLYLPNVIGSYPDYFTWGPMTVPDEKMADFHIVEWANYEMSRKHEKPFFMAVGITKPHDPWEVPQKYFDMYPIESIPDLPFMKDDLEDAYEHGRRQLHNFIILNGEEKKVIQAYLASISFVDAMVGKLLDGLQQSRHKDNTIVILWSDHGMHMGEKENWEKFTLWERSTRVPLFIKAPGISRPGSTTDEAVSLLDLYPTLAELIGEEIPNHCDGTSLVKLLKDPNATRESVVMGYEFTQGNGYAVRSEKYRYIYYPFSGLEELYDHEEDPHEWINLAYRKDLRQVILENRKILSNKVSGLRWVDQIPNEYELSENEQIKKRQFIPIENLTYENKWSL